MQRVRSPRSRLIGSHKQVSRYRQPVIGSSIGVVGASGIATLAPACGHALPSLAGIPTEYNHEVHGELLYELCAALVQEGLGTPDIWRQSGESAVKFAQHAVMSGIGAERGDLLQRNAEYHLQVSDVVERDGLDSILEDGRLAVTIECSGCGYLKIGPALDALEQEAEGLGAAFYWALTLALYRVMRLYNHDDALMYEERLIEYADSDDEVNRDQYEFPEVEKALPEYIRKTLKHDREGWRLEGHRLLQRHRGGKYRAWIERLRRIQRLSRLPGKLSQDHIEENNYDSPPLPSLLVAFKDHDAITACFDEESQYMLEGSSEPALYAVLSPQKPEEVRRALRVVERFVAINVELFQLAEELQETGHAGTDCHRGEPSLRAA
jgi:hypothetical protein